MFWNRDNSYSYSASYADPYPTASAHWGKALGYGVTCVIGAALITIITIGRASPPLADNLCPIGAAPTAHVVVLVDKTDDYSADQQRALETSLREHLRDLRLNDRLSLYQVTPGGSAVVQLVYDRCRPKTKAEADRINENPEFVGRDYQEQFVQPFEEALMTLTEPKPSDYSPILEALYAIAHEAPLAEPAVRRVIEIWSDLLAKSELIDMYGPNYDFEQLRQADSLYLEVPGLRGSEIRIFELATRYPMLQNGRHQEFWERYFGYVESQRFITRRL